VADKEDCLDAAREDRTRTLKIPGEPNAVKRVARKQATQRTVTLLSRTTQATGGLSSPKPSCKARTASSVYFAAMMQLILISLVLMA
jgi:hypothetical protein